MYDPKFEKAVRQRMEELEFRPAESVWAGIEKAVGASQRERRGAFLWRFVLPGLLVAAIAGFYVYHRSGTMVHVVKPAGAPQVVSPLETQGSASRGVPAGGDRKTGMAAGLNGTAAGLNRKGSGLTGTAAGRGTNGTDGSRPGVAADSFEGAAENQAAKEERVAPWLYTPGLADQRSALVIRASALNTRKGMISLTSLSPAKHPWEAGFVAGGGLSRLNRLNANYASQALAPQALSFYAISGSSSSKNYISDIRSDVSFDGGIYLQKALTDRWIFNTGLNLHYYSTRILVGQQVNAFASQGSSPFLNYPTTVTATGVPLYSAGDQQVYTNRYYFLELPVAMQWKVNRSRMLPLFLQGGISLARLMSANALYYNPQTGIYSKDGSMVNKTQFNVGMALLAGLPFRGIRIQAGPELQYGVTPLVNNQSLGDQHLFYAGLRVVVLPVLKR